MGCDSGFHGVPLAAYREHTAGGRVMQGVSEVGSWGAGELGRRVWGCYQESR